MRERLRCGPRRPRARSLHRSRHALYVDLDGWCLGLVVAGATARARARCWSSLPDLAGLARRRAYVEAGVLHVGAEPVRITRLVDVRRPDRAGRASTAPVRRAGHDVRPAGLALPADGRLTSADLDRLLGRGPGPDAARRRRAVPAGSPPTAPPGGPTTSLDCRRTPSPRRTTLLSATLLDCALRGEVLPRVRA